MQESLTRGKRREQRRQIGGGPTSKDGGLSINFDMLISSHPPPSPFLVGTEEFGMNRRRALVA